MTAAPPPDPPRSGANAAGLVLSARRHPRIFLCAALAAAAYFVLPQDLRAATRALIAWNVGGWAFLALVLAMMTRSDRDSVRLHAAQEDEQPWAILLVGIVAACAAMAAIVWELGPVKDLTGWPRAGHIALVVATILSAWTFIHVMFALHYAGEYYARTPDPADGAAVRGGLKFPGDGEPGWIDFLYQAFVIGCACATADVNTTTPAMRSVCGVQGVVAFFFNTVILALTINIGAGFV